MRVLVTGSTGFLGRHVVRQLLNDGHSVVAVARNAKRAREMSWFEDIEFIQCDLHKDFQPLLQMECVPNVLVHLAWPGLPNYCDFFHIDENLPADLAFLKAIVDSGVRHLLVAGTCLEYGMQYGPLTEDMETHPVTPYGLAKDTLRKSLQMLQKSSPFTLQWLRLFYIYGDGQNPNSLLSQLDRSIDNNDSVFNMSPGDQLRDYLTVADVAVYVARLLKFPTINGVINCCSGKPISVFDLVAQHCRKRGSKIQINRGYFPYPAYEPLAFWGVPMQLSRLDSIDVERI